MVQKLLQCERLLAYRNRYAQKTRVVDSMIDEFCAEAPDLEGFLFIEEGRSLNGSLSSIPFKVESLASSSCRFPFSFSHPSKNLVRSRGSKLTTYWSCLR